MDIKENGNLAKGSSGDIKLDSNTTLESGSKNVDSTKEKIDSTTTYTKDNNNKDTTNESPKQEEVTVAKNGFRKYFYYRETNKLGTVFISISLALMLVLLLGGNILLWIIFYFQIYIILRKVVAYQPFLLLLLLYLLCFLLFIILFSQIDDSGGKGNAWAFAFIFIGTPCVILFILGNMKYHTHSVPYAVIMIILIAILFGNLK